MRNPLNNDQVIEDKKNLRLFLQLFFILFYLGITALSSGRDKSRIERRETIFFKERVEMIIWHNCI